MRSLAPNRLLAVRAYVGPIVVGLSVLAVGLVPWLVLSRLNREVRPDLPWAALTTVAYVSLLLAWLNGRGPPAASVDERRRRLRLWPPLGCDQDPPVGLSASGAVVLLLALSAVWVLVGTQAPPPDLNAYPTTSYRWSMFLMGGLMSGVVEEVAFRGYMQTGLERHDPKNAVLITSLVFVASHVTHGLDAVLLLGPGFFAASMLYGVLAKRTGTILPGMAIHSLGDLAYTFFGVLKGDVGLLFVG